MDISYNISINTVRRHRLNRLASAGQEGEVEQMMARVVRMIWL
jgi:hypothetical protein